MGTGRGKDEFSKAGGIMSEENGNAESVSFWRYVWLWLAFIGGLALGLTLSGHSQLVMNPYSPLVLTLGCAALLGLSGICIWGLPLILPLGCISHSWLHGRDSWWRLLPAIVLLIGLLACLGLPLAGLQLPMFENTAYGAAPKVPDEAEMEAAYAVTVQAWIVCGRSCGILGLLLAIHILCLCGWTRSWNGAKGYLQSIRACSRELRAASAAQEREASAERAAERTSRAESLEVSQEGKS